MSMLATTLLLGAALQVGMPAPVASIGEVHEISKSYETVQKSSAGSSGSSRGRDMLIERVMATSDAGLELEFDLPDAATPEDRARSWQFPVRALKPAAGPMQVLNWPELDTRLDVWLAAAGMTRAHCGQWIFTWNAFRIDCDPESVLAVIEGFDLGRARLREGDAYQDDGAKAPGILERVSAGPDGARFSVVLDIDPDKVRRARAESDVIVGNLMGQDVSLESALLARKGETVSGTITVTIDADANGTPWRRARVTQLQSTSADAVTESETLTETVERRLLPDRGASAGPSD